MKKGLSTRGRAVFTSIIMGIIVFMVSSPLATNVYEAIFPPSEVGNIKVIEKNGEVGVSWTKNFESDVSGYKLNIDGQESVSVDSETLRYSFYELESGVDYNLSLSAIDNSGKSSIPFTVKVQSLDKAKTTEYNALQESNNSRTIFITALVLSVLMFILNLWVLFFRVSKNTAFTIAAFPSFCSIPFLIFSLSLIASLNTFGNKLVVSLVVVIAFVIGSYLLLLTSNILNGSLYSDLPLVQAGKASQFIFSLISSYLILIYAFGSYQDFALRLIVSLPFIYYFSYSSIWMNKNIANQQQVLVRSLAITLVMALTLLVLSIWPIEAVYAILAASVIFYILLNVALEIRKNLNRAVWIEYGVLTMLILVLLFANGYWGINGTII